MGNSDYVFEDKHGKCLCPDGMEEFLVVATETREDLGFGCSVKSVAWY